MPIPSATATTPGRATRTGPSVSGEEEQQTAGGKKEEQLSVTSSLFEAYLHDAVGDRISLASMLNHMAQDIYVFCIGYY